jgi:hypothetical protein
MRKLLNRKIGEQYRKCAICREEFTDYSTTATSFQITPKVWAVLGGMIIRTTSRQHTGSVWRKGSTRMDD